jgi:hypothetical protein
MDAPPAAESAMNRPTRAAREAKSTPAEKTLPSPFMMMTRTSGSTIRSSTIREIVSTISKVMAFRCSGRFRVR